MDRIRGSAWRSAEADCLARLEARVGGLFLDLFDLCLIVDFGLEAGPVVLRRGAEKGPRCEIGSAPPGGCDSASRMARSMNAGFGDPIAGSSITVTGAGGDSQTGPRAHATGAACAQAGTGRQGRGNATALLGGPAAAGLPRRAAGGGGAGSRPPGGGGLGGGGGAQPEVATRVGGRRGRARPGTGEDVVCVGSGEAVAAPLGVGNDTAREGREKLRSQPG